MQPSLRYFGLGLFVALCFVIAMVFDSPTSVILLVLLALLAIGLSFGSSRRARWTAAQRGMAQPAVDIEGLRRIDALVLIAAAMEPKAGRISWFKRVFYLRRFRVRSVLKRLEARGFIVPGSTVKRGHIYSAVTPAGEQAARVAAIVFELEDFAGPVWTARRRLASCAYPRIDTTCTDSEIFVDATTPFCRPC
jgi:hypothetical protein